MLIYEYTEARTRQRERCEISGRAGQKEQTTVCKRQEQTGKK